MKIRILSAEDVSQLLPMGEAIDVMAAAFAQFSAGRVNMPPRVHLDTQQGATLLMPAYLEQSGDCCVKLVSLYDDNPSRGLPLLTGVVVVFDSHTGFPRALLDARSLTAIRTGAAGGLAARLLARKDAHSVALIGTGYQGRTQLQAVLHVRRIRQVYLLDRDRSSAERLAAEVARWEHPPAVDVVDQPREAVQRADVVIAATTSATPVFDGRDLNPGTHLTAVGSYKPHVQEIDQVSVKRARVFVDSREAALSEAGDLIIAGVTEVVELGDVVTGKEPGRKSDDEITFFKAVGLAVQDAAASRVVADRAEQSGRGTVVDL